MKSPCEGIHLGLRTSDSRVTSLYTEWTVDSRFITSRVFCAVPTCPIPTSEVKRPSHKAGRVLLALSRARVQRSKSQDLAGLAPIPNSLRTILATTPSDLRFPRRWAGARRYG